MDAQLLQKAHDYQIAAMQGVHISDLQGDGDWKPVDFDQQDWDRARGAAPVVGVVDGKVVCKVFDMDDYAAAQSIDGIQFADADDKDDILDSDDVADYTSFGLTYKPYYTKHDRSTWVKIQKHQRDYHIPTLDDALRAAGVIA